MAIISVAWAPGLGQLKHWVPLRLDVTVMVTQLVMICQKLWVPCLLGLAGPLPPCGQYVGPFKCAGLRFLTGLSKGLHACVPSLFSHVQLLATPWTVACQASLSMGVSRQEYWSGFSCPPQGISLTPGSNLHLLRLLYQPRVLYCQCHLGSSKGIGDRQVSLFISRCHHCSLVWHGTPKVISKVSSHFKVF